MNIAVRLAAGTLPLMTSVFMLSLRSLSVSKAMVCLNGTNTIVWWGPTSSVETYAQANARIHRAGQDHKCTVVQLQGSDVERHVYALLDNKLDSHTKIIDLYKELLA